MQTFKYSVKVFNDYTKYLNKLIFDGLTNDVFAIDTFKNFEIKMKIQYDIINEKWGVLKLWYPEPVF